MQISERKLKDLLMENYIHGMNNMPEYIFLERLQQTIKKLKRSEAKRK